MAWGQTANMNQKAEFLAKSYESKSPDSELEEDDWTQSTQTFLDKNYKYKVP